MSVGGRKNADDRRSACALSGRLKSWRMRSRTSSASPSCTSGSVVQPNGGATTRAGARDTAGRLLIYGVVSLVCRGFSGGYLLLCLLAAVFLFGGWRLLPTARNNNAAVLRGDKQARVQMQNYIDRFPAFPLPARYAHPIVLRRMQRVILDGRAVTAEQALAVVKDDLKALNADVQVSQEEYDEVVAIKPMFLNADYQ